MPYVSDAQRRYFNANREKLESEGVDVDEWNRKSKGKKLPEKKSMSNKASIDLMAGGRNLLQKGRTMMGKGLDKAQQMAQDYGPNMSKGMGHAAGRIKGLPMGGKALLAASPLLAYGLYKLLKGRGDDKVQRAKYGEAGMKRLDELELLVQRKIAIDFFDHQASKLPMDKQAGVRSVAFMLAKGAMLDEAVDLSYPEKQASDCDQLVLTLRKAIDKFATERWEEIKKSNAISGYSAPSAKGFAGGGNSTSASMPAGQGVSAMKANMGF